MAGDGVVDGGGGGGGSGWLLQSVSADQQLDNSGRLETHTERVNGGGGGERAEDLIFLTGIENEFFFGGGRRSS